MKKLIVFVAAFVAACIYWQYQSWKKGREGDKPTLADTIETLSNKPSSFKLQTAWSDSLPADTASLSYSRALIDFYNASAILNNAYSDAENWRFFTAEADIAKVIAEADLSCICDRRMREDVDSCLTSLTQLMADYDLVVFDSLFYAGAHELRHKGQASLTERVVSLLPDEVEIPRRATDVNLKKSHWVPNNDSILHRTSACYHYEEQLAALVDHSRWLREQIDQAKTVEARHVLLLDYAQASLLTGDDEIHAFDISLLESYLNAEQYSPFLWELWRMWRFAKQCQKGLDADAEIPNAAYNARRMQCANTILHHLVGHPDDGTAVLQFLTLASEQNVVRCFLGEGNSAQFDSYLLFWEVI